MVLRDLVVVSIVALSVLLGFRVPFIGLLSFTWLAYMRPQDLCWGFARSMRLSYVVGAVMLAGWIFHDAYRRRFTHFDARTKLMVALFFATLVSLIGAREQNEFVQRRFFEFGKVVLVALFTAGQLTDRRRLRLFFWVVALSLGFYGMKDGLFGILRGGAIILRGPGGMLEDNNDYALALVMNLPFLFYLGRMEGSRWIRWGTAVGMLLTMMTVLLTHSRGGFLAMSTVLIVIWLRSHHRMRSAAIVALGIIAFFMLVPSHVLERLSTISEYEQDASARGRLFAWGVALRMIGDHPVLGVGMLNYTVHFYDYIDFTPRWAPVAHNSYLQIWAEGGTISILLFLALIVSSLWTLRRLHFVAARAERGDWILQYARMMEASLAGFLVGSIFLNRGHFDLFYHLLGALTAFNLIALRWLERPEDVEEDEERPPIRVTPAPRFGRRGEPLTVRARGGRPQWGR